MKNLIISTILIFSMGFGTVWADEELYNTNITNFAFGPFSIPLPVRLDILGQFNQNAPIIAAENNTAFESAFYPSFLITTDSDTKIYSLSKTENLGPDNTLVSAKIEDGYLYIKSSELEVGFGIQAAMSAGLTFSIGLEPYFGKGKTEVRLIPSKDKKFLKELESLEVPKNKEILDKWKIGEKLTYFKKGGIQFSASAGYAVVGVKIGFAAEGMWKVIIEKIGVNKIEAHLRQVKLKSLQVGVSTLTPSTYIHKYWKFDEDFSFIFDFNDQLAIDTLKEMLNGRMKKVQELAKDLNMKSVTAISHETKYISGHNFYASFTLPGLFSSKFINSHEYEDTQAEYYRNDLRIRTHTGENSRYALTTGAASKNYNRYEFFDGNIAEVEKLDKSEKRVVTWAHYHYLFARDKFDTKLLNKEITKMFKKIGYYDQLKLKAPVEGKFGHMKMQLDTLINNAGVLKVLNNTMDKDYLVAL
ncbi:MAG: hypothetical protein E2O68_05515, partial [Deltaproteobacteria bacterium]